MPRRVPGYVAKISSLAYAISIHKSEGSEYRGVIVLIGSEHLPALQRHLIYTAITRGKEHVFVIAEPPALRAAIQSDDRRWEKLTELLTRGRALHVCP